MKIRASSKGQVEVEAEQVVVAGEVPVEVPVEEQEWEGEQTVN